MMRSSTTSQSAFDFKNYLEDRRVLVEAKLDELLAIDEPQILWESMRYSALGAGKRIRALLSIASFETINRINGGAGGDTNLNSNSQIEAGKLEKFLAPVLPVACAIEMVHAMSLVHDDLPCLDNDDVRRGKATNHKAYGEAMALLAGDALLMRAVEVLICSRDIQCDIVQDQSLLDKSILDITRGLAVASGANGMVGGQVFDLVYTGAGAPIPAAASNPDREPISVHESNQKPKSKSDSDSLPHHSVSEPISVHDAIGMQSRTEKANSVSSTGEVQSVSSPLDETVIRKIHAGKTGALLRFSLWSGARLAQATKDQLAALEQFGDIVGLAFQITDDLLDVTGDVETLGKTPGKDQAANKATWVSVFGIDGAREKLHKLEDEGKQLLLARGLSHAEQPVLESLLEMAIHRRK
jgi:geranylgeranyl diphosphate synthase type II